MRTLIACAQHWWSAIDCLASAPFEQEERWEWKKNKICKKNKTKTKKPPKTPSAFLSYLGEDRVSRMHWSVSLVVDHSAYDLWFFVRLFSFPSFTGKYRFWRLCFCGASSSWLLAFLRLFHSPILPVPSNDDDDLSTDEWWSNALTLQPSQAYRFGFWNYTNLAAENYKKKKRKWTHTKKKQNKSCWIYLDVCRICTLYTVRGPLSNVNGMWCTSL